MQTIEKTSAVVNAEGFVKYAIIQHLENSENIHRYHSQSTCTYAFAFAMRTGISALYIAGPNTAESSRISR